MGAVSGLSNAEIAELLALEAEKVEGQLRMTFKRAARSSFIWPVEVTELLNSNEPLTLLPGVGPYLQKRIRSWVEAGTPAPEPPPPIRRGFLSVPEARKILGRHGAWRSAYRGDLQMHSTWSDGSGTIKEMADAAMELGYSYIGITDHSKGLKIAGGINEGHLERQRIEIEAINADLRGRFRVLHGIELNLNPEGEGDMNPSVLAKLDFVVGSFHSALRRVGDQTARYVAALENPDVQILGHPRGRIYNHREGLQADWSRVFARAAELNKAVEIDSYPDRQDLNVQLLRIAKREGVRIAIDTDAHTPEQLVFVELGLAAAVKAGIPKERVVNFMKTPELLKWVASTRGGKRARKTLVLQGD